MVIELSQFKNKPELNIGIHKSKNDYFHVTIKNKNAIGTGSNKDPQIAQLKALYEMIERSVFQVHGESNTSSGWAAHSNLETAIQNAKNEIIERDAVLLTWFLKRPPKSAQEIKINSFQYYKFWVFDLYSDENVIVSAGLVYNPNNNKKMFISAASRTVKDVEDKLKEDLSRAIYLLENSFTPHHSMKHHNDTFNRISIHDLYWLFKTGQGLPKTVFDISYKTFKIPLWNSQIAWVVYAESTQLQKIFWGPANIHTVNRNRLRNFASRPYKFNREPHPLL